MYRFRTLLVCVSQPGSVKLAADSDSYWGNAMIGMYFGKRYDRLIIFIAPPRYYESLAVVNKGTRALQLIC